ncbi:MAG: ABC transporter substrate-binding protein [Chloroflexi bacterium]|nr:ABC transporter substrate-binding protein [Chloroflexota bacterium]
MQRRVFLACVLAPSMVVLVAACRQTVSTPASPPTTAAGGQGTAAAAPPTPAAAPTAPAAATAQTGPRSKVAISFSDRTASDLALFLAKTVDLFGKYNVDADLQYVASNTGIPALISDQTQFALIGGPETLAANVEGADLVAILQNSGAQPYVMEVAGSIQTIDDLKGKKVGISSVGSSSDSATRISLRLKGLNPDQDVNIVAVGSLENRMSAMLNGAVDAGLASPPDTLALEDGGMHVLYDCSQLSMPPLAQCLITRRATINSQRDLVQRVVNAVVEATAVQKRDKAASQKALTDWANMTDQRVLDVAYDYWTNHVLRIPPTLKQDDFQAFVDDLAQRNEKAKGFDPSKMIDTSFVDAATQQGLAG